MDDESALRARLQAWLEEHGRSARWVSIEAGLSENTVWRYLEGATKRLRPENWATLCGVLGWDVAMTLAEAGYAPVPAAPEDPVGQIDRILQQAGVAEAGRAAILWAVRQALAQVAHPTSGVPR